VFPAEEEIVNKLRKGDERMFEQVFEHYYNLPHDVAVDSLHTRIGNPGILFLRKEVTGSLILVTDRSILR
jgi:hypothetical protein